MTGKMSADNALGKGLICLRMSNLNFVAKETPFSTYITIRKKLIKPTTEAVIENRNIELEGERLRKVADDVSNEKIKDLLTKCAMLEFEKEELEVKYEALEKTKIEVDDQIEEIYARNKELSKSHEKLVNDNNELKDTIERLECENKSNSKKYSKKTILLEESNKDLEEKLLMLENVIESRDSEISKLKSNSNSVEQSELLDKVVQSKESEYIHSVMETVRSFYSGAEKKLNKCEECEFDTNTSEDLKRHMEKHHQSECKDCKERFIGNQKLKNHMCRVHIHNPSYREFYVKSWFVKNECVRVFSEHQNKEIAILHSCVCVEKPSCSYVLPDFINQSRYTDDTGFLHLHLSEILSCGEVKWEIIQDMMELQK